MPRLSRADDERWRRALPVAVALVALAVTACTTTVPYHLTRAPEAFTLTGLHPDETRGRLVSVNYQHDGYIPPCTRVRILEVTPEEMLFRIQSTGATYEYVFHRTLAESIPAHLDRVFGSACDADVFADMSDADRWGIEHGAVVEGMTKAGVIRAVGYPPPNLTPDLDDDAWTYHVNRLKRMELAFADGRVVAVRGGAKVRYPLVGRRGVYTRVNLHPDERNRRLYSLNYLREGLIPMCSEVRLEEITPEALTFRVVQTGRQYTYFFHSTLGGHLTSHLDRVFGTSCDAAALDAMGDLDRQGVVSGRVLVGMSKEAVVLALGYPPAHTTPSLDSDMWIYWISRSNRTKVLFDDGRVVQIIR